MPGGIEFSPDGRLLGVAGVDGIVSIVNADTGDEERRLSTPETPAFLNVAFSPDSSPRPPPPRTSADRSRSGMSGPAGSC
jgi:WD40 repeat protein